MSGTNQYCARIDVSKNTLEIAFSCMTDQLTMPNNIDGFTQLSVS